MKIDLDRTIFRGRTKMPDEAGGAQSFYDIGMTIGEYAWIKFAAAALTGLTNNVASRHVDDTIGDAIIYADAMLAKIERRNESDGD